MKKSGLLLLAVDRALREPDQLPPLQRADLFEAIAIILDLAAEDIGSSSSTCAAEIQKRAEQAREVAFQLREGEHAQLTFIESVQALTSPQPVVIDTTRP